MHIYLDDKQYYSSWTDSQTKSSKKEINLVVYLLSMYSDTLNKTWNQIAIYFRDIMIIRHAVQQRTSKINIFTHMYEEKDKRKG